MPKEAYGDDEEVALFVGGVPMYPWVFSFIVADFLQATPMSRHGKVYLKILRTWYTPFASTRQSRTSVTRCMGASAEILFPQIGGSTNYNDGRPLVP